MSDPLEGLADALAARGLSTKFIPDADGAPGESLLVRIRGVPSIGDTIRLIEGRMVDSVGADLGAADEADAVAATIALRMATPARFADHIRANPPRGAT
ncbi:hypothetical protein [Actinomadura harenae]|uniref:Uncharacterized protein n=1 Tax=Actinomadura harenae TaxID=2483351 RepID=A0A3M2MBU9_9ACTN|nr:hypothetical protein [Actinomadura harenae]RMI44668.1 hypothetical protein EBO15_11960 [Actinomadura harenae]